MGRAREKPVVVMAKVGRQGVFMVRCRVAEDVRSLGVESRALDRWANDRLTRLVDKAKTSRWLVGRWRGRHETPIVHRNHPAATVATNLAQPKTRPR